MVFFYSHHWGEHRVVKKLGLVLVGFTLRCFVEQIRGEYAVLFRKVMIRSNCKKILPGDLESLKPILCGIASRRYGLIRQGHKVGIEKFYDVGIHCQLILTCASNRSTPCGRPKDITVLVDCREVKKSIASSLRGYVRKVRRAEALADSFIIAKNEGLVLLDWPTGRSPILIASKRRDFGGIKDVAGIERAVTDKLIGAAMKLICSGLGDRADDAT